MIRNKITGKIRAARIPVFMEPAASVTNPTTDGPAEQPTSPASANIAYIIVPPPRQRAAPREKTPGHIRPTEKPQSAQPARDKSGIGDRLVMRYPTIHSALVPSRPWRIFSLSPLIPYRSRESPMKKAKAQGPRRSPTVLLTPSPSSANREDHWLTACSDAPAHIISRKRTQSPKSREISPGINARCHKEQGGEDYHAHVPPTVEGVEKAHGRFLILTGTGLHNGAYDNLQDTAAHCVERHTDKDACVGVGKKKRKPGKACKTKGGDNEGCDSHCPVSHFFYDSRCQEIYEDLDAEIHGDQQADLLQ